VEERVIAVERHVARRDVSVEELHGVVGVEEEEKQQQQGSCLVSRWRKNESSIPGCF
jgi:hypothetical protein